MQQNGMVRGGRFVIVVVFVVPACMLAGSLVPFAQAPVDAPPVFHSTSSELVVLPVAVTDKQGRFVSDLTRDRFTVYDNGRPQPLSMFMSQDTPVSVGLVVDSSGSMRAKLPFVEAAAIAFARWSNPDDEVSVIAFNESARDVLPGRTIRAADIDALQNALSNLVPEGRTALYDALVLALERLESARHPRKVVVLISDGGDNVSRATLKDVLARARAGNVAIYTIGLFDDFDRDRNPDVLKELAKTTGAERFLPKSAGPMLQACERIAHEIRHEYTVAFVPPERDGSFHAIQVRVGGPDAQRFTIRTRPGYVAGGAPAARGAEVKE